jgi:hypothetical protein
MKRYNLSLSLFLVSTIGFGCAPLVADRVPDGDQANAAVDDAVAASNSCDRRMTSEDGTIHLARVISHNRGRTLVEVVGIASQSADGSFPAVTVGGASHYGVKQRVTIGTRIRDESVYLVCRGGSWQITTIQ